MARPSPQRTETARLRLASGMSQKEAANTLGVSKSFLQKVELGQLLPTKRLSENIKKLRR